MDSGRVEFPKELIRGFSQGACQMVQFFFCGPTIVVRADLEFSDEGFYRGSTIVSSQLDPRMTRRHQRRMFTGSGFSGLSCRCRTCSSRRERLEEGGQFTSTTFFLYVSWTRDSRPFPFSWSVAHQTES